MACRVGVIGGGQLAWMMADAVQRLGLELIIQTPSAHDPAVAIASHTLYAAVEDAAATAQLAAHCDVITFENEFVDLTALRPLAAQGVSFYPRLSSLAPLLDKYDQRTYLRQRGLPTPHFTSGETAQVRPEDLPVVLKTRRLGYDGQGTVIVKTLDDWHQWQTQWRDRPYLVEEFIPFERELAVMAARSARGEFVLYPVVETQQKQQVCVRVFALPELDAPITRQVEAIARSLLESLDYVGIMGIEFFLTSEGQVLVNETAPRTHNSGHYTLDACPTSQFEQQLRAVCGLPLGDGSMTCAGAVMVNLLGYESAESDYLEKRQHLAHLPNAHLYWYGKSQSRPGRKLGHVTCLIPTAETASRERAEAIAQAVERIWYG